MTMTAVVGDCTTTTTLALAAATPADGTLVVEADPTGGSVAPWCDAPVSPSLSTVVTAVRGADGDPRGAWPRIEELIRRSASGLRFVPAPVSSIEAGRAIHEAEHTVFPAIASNADSLFDVGRRTAADGVPEVIRLADTVVVCHRQSTASPAAAAVRLERTGELVESLGSGGARLILAVIGDAPFDLGEIGAFVGAATDDAVEAVRLAEDELAAAVLAGRRGVSARRFARLPLVVSCRRLAAQLAPGPDPARTGSSS